MKISMDVDQANLDEVVVVGYGQQKKANLTGAVANIDVEKTLTSRPEQDVAKALQGAIPVAPPGYSPPVRTKDLIFNAMRNAATQMTTIRFPASFVSIFIVNYTSLYSSFTK